MRYGAILVFLFSSFAMADTTTITCEYSTYSDEKGLHDAEDGFVLQFLIDDETGKAYTVGNQGGSELATINGAGAITFIEITETGNVMTTTILSNNKSIHSRHSVIMGYIIPSQYYGTCK